MPLRPVSMPSAYDKQSLQLSTFRAVDEAVLSNCLLFEEPQDSLRSCVCYPSDVFPAFHLLHARKILRPVLPL